MRSADLSFFLSFFFPDKIKITSETTAVKKERKKGEKSNNSNGVFPVSLMISVLLALFYSFMHIYTHTDEAISRPIDF